MTEVVAGTGFVCVDVACDGLSTDELGCSAVLAVALSRYQPPTSRECFPFSGRSRRLQPESNVGLHCTGKVRLRIRHVAFMALQKGEAVRRYSPTPRPVTTQRIERALDRVAEIIVARGDHGEAWLPLYDYLERALQDHRAKEERLAAVRRRVIRSQDRTATRSS